MQKIEISQTQENVFNALLNPSAIAEWWGAKTAIVIKENNGIYAVSWGANIDIPDYITVSIIRNYVPKNGFSLEYLTYKSLKGNLPFEAKMIVYFSITPRTVSTVSLAIRQTGIPSDQIADEYFEGCTKGWNQVLNNLKEYCENNAKEEIVIE